MVAESPSFRLQGKLLKLFSSRDPEILFDGPRGTGKTRPMCEYCVSYAMAFPGSRVVIVRKTRKSMTETTLVTLELVLRRLHPEALTDCSRGHVSSYRVGSSDLIVTGCDDEEKLRGLEASIIWVDECNELTIDDWESLQGALRWPIGKWHTIIGTCNPDSDQHWMWKRFRDGRITRIQSSHKDNPVVTKEYLHRLSRLTGIRRKRFWEGIWTKAEGQILDAWDEDYNVITVPERADGEPDYDALSISWYFAAMDWGHSAAGCLGVWGVTLDGRLIETAEIYYTKKTTSWWCDQLAHLNRKFALRAIVADPSRPDMIADFNTCLGYNPEAPDAICFGANNKRASSGAGDLAGINLMCDAVQRDASGKPRVMYARDNLVLGIDQDLRDAGLPCCSIEEVSNFCWAKSKEGLYIKDVVDPKAQAHGMDQTRYALMFARHYDMADAVPVIPKDEPGTYGAMYKHNAVMAAMKVAEEEGLPFDEVYADLQEME